MKILGLLIAATLLSGCVATQQARRMTFDNDPSLGCFDRLAFDPDIRILVPKVGGMSVERSHMGSLRSLRAVETSSGMSVEQMANAEKPSAAEKTALSAWGTARQQCAALGRAFREQYAPPDYVDGFDDVQSSVLQAIASLYAGNITYGQFIVERQRIAATGRAQMTAASDSFGHAVYTGLATGRAQMTAASDRDAVARRATARANAIAADNALQTMILQQQANRPINTTCNRIDTMVSCTSQ